MAAYKSLAILFCLIYTSYSQVILNPRFAYLGAGIVEAPVVAAPIPVPPPVVPATVPGSDGKQPLVNNGLGLLTQSAPLVNAPRVAAIAGVPVPAPLPVAARFPYAVAAPVPVAAPALIPSYAPFAKTAVIYGSNKSA
uniref:Cyclin-dependent kinase inhibitor 1C-like n=1 Tax=Parastrongyloides trichosuri TaxID=131310 RepID=A0A0N4ZQR3_PARTI